MLILQLWSCSFSLHINKVWFLNQAELFIHHLLSSSLHCTIKCFVSFCAWNSKIRMKTHASFMIDDHNCCHLSGSPLTTTPGNIYFSWLLLPHILMGLDQSLGCVWSLLSPVLLSPYICLSEKCDASSLWSLLLIILCVLFQVTTWVEVVWLRYHSAMLHASQLSPESTHFTYSIICVRYSINATCKLWFCCSFLNMWHLLHVCPSSERDPPLWLFLRFLTFYFYFLVLKFCFSEYVKLSSLDSRLWRQRICSLYRL